MTPLFELQVGWAEGGAGSHYPNIYSEMLSMFDQR